MNKDLMISCIMKPDQDMCKTFKAQNKTAPKPKTKRKPKDTVAPENKNDSDVEGGRRFTRRK